MTRKRLDVPLNCYQPLPDNSRQKSCILIYCQTEKFDLLYKFEN